MNTNRKISQKREDYLAKKINGKRHVMSGGTWSRKGDVSNENILIEDKFTKNDYYNLKLSTILKNNKEAVLSGKVPVLTIGFENYKENFAIVELGYHRNYIEEIEYNTYEVETNKKSIRLKYSLLKSLHQDIDCKHIMLITFITDKRLDYALYRFDDFLSQINMFSI